MRKKIKLEEKGKRQWFKAKVTRTHVKRYT